MTYHLAIGNLVPTNDPLADLAQFGFTGIDDGEAAAITGGASATVEAKATAYGPFTQTYTQTDTVAVGSKYWSAAVGEGMAVAAGHHPSSNVNASGTGDNVKTISSKIDLPGGSVAVGGVLAYSRK
jgi:hypothetical protein